MDAQIQGLKHTVAHAATNVEMAESDGEVQLYDL